MNILILGATGFIGSAIARKLVNDGHRVTGLGRDPSRAALKMPALHWISADLAGMTRSDDWQDALEGHDMVVNCAGALQDGLAAAITGAHALFAFRRDYEASQPRIRAVMKQRDPAKDIRKFTVTYLTGGLICGSMLPEGQSKENSVRRIFGLAAIFCSFSISAFAAAPNDIADLVGSRAADAESEMRARGYEHVGSYSAWWNDETGTCVRVRVSNGRYSRIDRLKPSACGQTSAASPPPDFSNVPARALRACSRRANRYQSPQGGASVVKAAERTGPTWLLTMATRHYILKCTVTGSGRVIRMETG
ncbi:NAD-dependent epimerase/dehydratase family protein [Sinorhizobium mexicanum]|uniref:NAD-dependent epimerase/dehydratase family protein n=1 Tax=Sinorhizobium mexicanum TaxID=375549 RepID=A0A859QCS4_9HYPH|nr:NAD(P)-dependent dehydrogenase (short-subunit alcohol dehydrogenase family) [Sinorhizobium mexicanum]QLL62443.1 NAD-dependent epimerase/dehydratase family protein [Sinorhizobium mexicanum]